MSCLCFRSAGLPTRSGFPSASLNASIAATMLRLGEPRSPPFLRLCIAAGLRYCWRAMNAAGLTYLWIALGGALGSVGRYWLNGIISERFATFPAGTLVINILGSLVIGFAAALALPEGRLTPESRALVTQFVMIGICGGFTTFSSFSLQTLNLLRDREWLYAGGNVLLSVLLCLVATWLGYMIGLALNSAKGS
jgi:CrcB protein